MKSSSCITRRFHSLLGNRLDEREVRVGVGVRIDHRADEGANPILPLAVIAQHFVAGDVCGGEGSVLEGVLVAARRSNFLAVFSRRSDSAWAIRGLRGIRQDNCSLRSEGAPSPLPVHLACGADAASPPPECGACSREIEQSPSWRALYARAARAG